MIPRKYPTPTPDPDVIVGSIYRSKFISSKRNRYGLMIVTIPYGVAKQVS